MQKAWGRLLQCLEALTEEQESGFLRPFHCPEDKKQLDEMQSLLQKELQSFAEAEPSKCESAAKRC